MAIIMRLNSPLQLKYYHWIFLTIHCINSQCYIDSDISIYQSGYLENGDDQCLGNYTVINANLINGTADNGITCSRRYSTSMSGTWKEDHTGNIINCNDNTKLVRCVRKRPGSVTLYTQLADPSIRFDKLPEAGGNYSCCIEGLCIIIRLLQDYNIIETTIFHSTYIGNLESCIVIPPNDITVIPQQYIVQMNTSEIPPSIFSSFISCTDGLGVICGQSYYTLIDLSEERYQFSLPITWSTNDATNYEHDYSCISKLGNLINFEDPNPMKKLTSINAAGKPDSVGYEEVNATAVKITWTIPGNLNGFIITVSTGSLDPVTAQLTDGIVREFVVDQLSPETDYIIEVRGYYELLGPAGVVSVRLEAPASLSPKAPTPIITPILQNFNSTASAIKLLQDTVNTSNNILIAGVIVGVIAIIILLIIVALQTAWICRRVRISNNGREILVNRRTNDNEETEEYETPFVEISTDIEMSQCAAYETSQRSSATYYY